MRANLDLVVSNAAAYSASVDASSTATIYPVNSELAMLALAGVVGDIATRSDTKLSYTLTALPANVLANWSILGFPVDTLPMLNGIATPTTGGMSGAAIVDHVHTNLPILNNTTASYTAADQVKLSNIAPSATANLTDAALLNRANHTGTQLSSTISDFVSSVNNNILVSGAVQSSSIGSVNGVAGLDGNGLIQTVHLPALAITSTTVVSNETSMLSIAAQVGDVAVRTDLSKTFILTSTPATSLLNWQEMLTPTDLISSVNGQVGAISLTTADISENTNLYYTDARVTANATVAAAIAHSNIAGNPHNSTTANIPEGTNLYYTDTRVTANAAVALNTAHRTVTGNPHGSTTTDISEGLNLYYTDLRVAASASVAANTAHSTSTGNPHGAVTGDIAETTNLYYTDLRVTSNAAVSANTSARHVHSNSLILDSTTASYTTGEKSKLSTIVASATLNSSDAYLMSRANHTGTQLASTIIDFAAAVSNTQPFATNAQALAGVSSAVSMTPINTRDSIVDSKHIIAIQYALS